MADGACLALVAAAFDLDHGVVAALGPGDAEGHQDLGQVDGVAEVLLEAPAVHDDLALALHQADARDAGLPPAGAGEERGVGGHAWDSPSSGADASASGSAAVASAGEAASSALASVVGSAAASATGSA